MGIFGWNGTRGLPPLDGDDENKQHCAGHDGAPPEDRTADRMQDVERASELLAELFRGEGCDEYAGFFHALTSHLLALLVTPSWWERFYTPAQRREAESLIHAHSAPLLATLNAQDRLVSTWLDDQCAYCRQVLTEHGEPLSEIEYEYRAHGGYVCATHLARLSAHSAACAEIDELLAPPRRSSGQAQHTSLSIANRYRFGYLGDRLPSDYQAYP